jgi:hypothetical protein
MLVLPGRWRELVLETDGSQPCKEFLTTGPRQMLGQYRDVRLESGQRPYDHFRRVMSVQVVTEFPCHQSHAPSVVTQPRHFRDVRRQFGPGRPFCLNMVVQPDAG